jgi:hypothetical protein
MEASLFQEWVELVWAESVVKQTSTTTRVQPRLVINRYIKMHLCLAVQVPILQTQTFWLQVAVNWQMVDKDSITELLTWRTQYNVGRAIRLVVLQSQIQEAKLMASIIIKASIRDRCLRTHIIVSSNSPIELSKTWMAMEEKVNSREAVDQVRVKPEQPSLKVNMLLTRRILVLEPIPSARKRKCQAICSVVTRTNTQSHLWDNNTVTTAQWQWEIGEIECWVLVQMVYLTPWLAKFKAQRSLELICKITVALERLKY